MSAKTCPCGGTGCQEIVLSCPCGARLEYTGKKAAKRADEFYAAHAGHERPAPTTDTADEGVPEGTTVVTGSLHATRPTGFVPPRGRVREAR